LNNEWTMDIELCVVHFPLSIMKTSLLLLYPIGEP
jgi:hypothetical protein